MASGVLGTRMPPFGVGCLLAGLGHSLSGSLPPAPHLLVHHRVAQPASGALQSLQAAPLVGAGGERGGGGWCPAWAPG